MFARGSQRIEGTGRRWKPRLILAMALTMVLTAASVATLVIVQGYPEIRQSHLERAKVEALTAFRSAVDPGIYPTLVELLELGTYVTTVSPIRGGAFFDSIGEYKGHFGTRPLLTWRAAKLDEIDSAFVSNGAAMEMFVDGSDIGVPYGVALQFDLANAWAGIDRDVARAVTEAAAIASALAAALTIMLSAMVILPLNRMDTAIRHALDDPKGAVSNALNWRRKDEFGLVSRGVDQLFYVLSNTFEEDLGNALAIQAHAPFGLVIYNADHSVAGANRAALAFFGVSTPKEIGEFDPAFLRRAADGDRTAEPIAVADLLRVGRVLETGQILRGEDWVPAQIGGAVIRRPNGKVRRYFFMFSDLTDLDAQIAEARAERDALRRDLALEQQQSLQQRHLLDACISVIEEEAPLRPRERARPVMPAQIVNKWYADALRGGFMKPESLRHSRLPPLRIDAAHAEKLFSHALFSVHQRSAAKAPRILVRGNVTDDGRPVYVITEITGDTEDLTAMRAVHSANASIYVTALNRSLVACGGRLLSSIGASNENAVVFDLPPAGIRTSGKTPERRRAA